MSVQDSINKHNSAMFNKFFGPILTKSEIAGKPMDKEKFNKYCAEIMGYSHIYKSTDFDWIWIHDGKHERQYNPHDDLNQMAGVVEKLLDDANIFYLAKLSSHTLDTIGIKQAFRNFITSTMEKDDG